MTEQKYKKIRGRHPFVIKWTNWEFLPIWLVYIPVLFYGLWLSLKSGRLFWLTPINPAIKNEGLFGWSKEQIQSLIPEDLLPTSLFFEASDTFKQVFEAVEQAGLKYPLIAKPNQGLRGIGVSKLWSTEALKEYVEENTLDYQIQDFVDAPVEAGIMFYKVPGTNEYDILSITLKDFLNVTGDGVSTLGQLILKNRRALLVLDTIKEKFIAQWEEILPKGENILLEPIGNHSRGTRFYSGQGLKTPEMVEAYAALTERIEGLNFCRYDLRCETLEDLVNAENLTVIEINGSWSEPAHIYDNAIGLWEKYQVLFKQWGIMYRIAKVSRAMGGPDLSMKEGFRLMKQYSTLKD